MVHYCCVPFCTSGYKSAPGISFHEIPANIEQRNKWLKAISRKDWLPNSNSNYSRVCSLHFLQSDFKPNLKRKILQPNAVPSVFPNYPSYMEPPQKKLRTSRPTGKCNSLSHIQPQNSIQSQNNNENSIAFNIDAQSDIPANLQTTSGDQSFAAAAAVEAGIQVDLIKKTAVLSLKSFKRRNSAAHNQIKRLKLQRNAALDELNGLKKAFKELQLYKFVLQLAEEGDTSAIILTDQVNNFKKRRPTWSEKTIRSCVLWRNCSPKGYEFVRNNNIYKLPCKTTLSRYIGSVSDCNEVGVSPLITHRLKTETSQFKDLRENVCSLIVDEMAMQEYYTYDKMQDKFVGSVNMGPAVSCPLVIQNDGNSELAKSLLCFVISGLLKSYKIPVSYFFVRQLKGDQLYKIALYVISEVEKCGLSVVRLVADNHRINQCMFKLLGSGKMLPEISHPIDPARKLFLSYDYCHIIKNIRNQFLKHDFGWFVKELYEVQHKMSDAMAKPVRFLSKKHVYPSSFEKMNVLRAVQIFSPPVTAALKFLQLKAGRLSHPRFSQAGPAITFMVTVFKWFTVHDASNYFKAKRINNPDCCPFEDVDDERLNWLESNFPNYIKSLQTAGNRNESLLSEETYQAAVLTSQSTAMCIRALIKDHKFDFVLTRKFSSDPVEALFGCLRQSAGCHNQLNAVAVQNALKKILVTGIVATTGSSSVLTEYSLSESSLIQNDKNLVLQVNAQTELVPVQQIETEKTCIRMLLFTKPDHVIPTTVLTASIAYLAGYALQVINEKMECEFCINLLQRPRCSNPALQLIFHQDRIGLKYPKDSLISIILTLHDFAKLCLPILSSGSDILQKIAEMVKPYMMKCPALLCNTPNEDSRQQHREKLCDLISMKVLRPMLTNFGKNVTEANLCAKLATKNKKPLGSKI